MTSNYSSGINDSISRLSSLSDSTGTLESYSYLGVGTVVIRSHSQPGIDLTYVKQSGESNGDAGDQYIGLDRFGRVVDQRWLNTSTSTATDRFQYGYDRDSNRLYRDNLVDTGFGELYTYDGLNQLTSFSRGTLNAAKTGITGTATRSQGFDYDALGNFDSVTTDGGTPETRTANKQNEITGISGSTTPVYDNNGNMTTDQSGKTFSYDAWNRMVRVKDSGGATLETFTCDGRNHRVTNTVGTATTNLYYSNQWQVLEEQQSGNDVNRYVWSPVYVDAMVLRDRDTDSDGTLDERLSPQQDANWNVTALVNASGAVVERYVYDAYGTQTVYDGSYTSRASSLYSATYGFQGMQYDKSAGLNFTQTRPYSPTLGRFTGPDWIKFDGGDVNLYGFVGNSPDSWVDAEGLRKVPPDPPFGYFKGERDLLNGIRREALQKQNNSTDAAVQAIINGMKFPCQKAKDKVYAAVKQLIDIARIPWNGRVGLFGDCVKWQEQYLKKMAPTIAKLRKDGIIGCAFEVDPISWSNTNFSAIVDLGHNAIRLQFFDGTNIYLDDTNVGGSDHVFVDAEVPGRYQLETPAKATFGIDYDIKQQCKALSKSCLDRLCD